jgi:small subunit ribosomal protein S16
VLFRHNTTALLFDFFELSVGWLHMLVIRFQRIGRKNDPAFRAVVTDSKNAAKSGKFLEIVGSYNPKAGTAVFKTDRLTHWIKEGAKPSDTLHNFLISQKLIEGKKRNVLSKKSPTKKKKEAKAA